MRNLDGQTELESVATAEKQPITVIQLDVDSDSSVERAVQQILTDKGRIDVLVNNAGVGGRGPVNNTSLDYFRQIMETNFFGSLRCIKAVLPGMCERRAGCIVNISSLSGRIAVAPQTPYAASKFAVEALSECLAQEMKAFNVRVAIVEPGVTATPIFGKGKPAPANMAYPHGRRLTRAVHCIDEATNLTLRGR